ncbi:N-acetylmuramic acid 6-phosphate etherase [Amnibacterium sp. CER49]|uniref:N-acetylmuramic acid 6-phosphate etherase n=1 Tax=Amnibacterium sp. CER49 TaxID=3039161 RepID=UPI00244BD9AC|nr:N-acetylmuramic acid 6-phosphate etherase [Amnibacterium sp. CER49]MDH2442584.1 N-acetylmuramic acid 6-phosphate etherase [Amnibacterium sp. CER49]
MTGDLTTETRNPATAHIDSAETAEILEALYREDLVGVHAVRRAAATTARAVEETLRRVRAGGSIHYFGAGASGRIAVLDATEIRPTFGAPPGLFTAHFAGGSEALFDSSIDREDAEDSGGEDAAGLGPASVAIGVTASGATAYVTGALREARRLGALTVLITCNPNAAAGEHAEITIVADTGPEALTGSTRLKAGTATKVLLNSFSTALMIRLGAVYSNLMVNLVPSNDKLRRRAVAVLTEATGLDEARCREMLERADGSTPVALVALLSGRGVDEARGALDRSTGVRAAVELLRDTD